MKRKSFDGDLELNDDAGPPEQRRELFQFMEQERAVGKFGWNQQGISPSSENPGPSDVLRKPSFNPRHRIFLSHGGAQTDFTEQLCEDLLKSHHFAFFDKCPDSCTKGEMFVPLIKEAAKRCGVAVLVLSEDFFSRSKWPMMELNEFVKARESTNPALKILPLFLGLKLNELEDKMRRENWLKRWEEFARKDEEINLEDWKHALSRVRHINALQYDGEGHVAFRKKVVEAICKLMPPDVHWDESRVQSREKLCKPILQKFNESKPSRNGAHVLGLHGMGGVGKTTISRVLCKLHVGEFAGRACHVEFGGNNSLELKKRVLRELTQAPENLLKNKDSGELDSLLMRRMGRQKVFLALDNVGDDQIAEAKKYLEAQYHDGSLVLVTSRSLDVLVEGLHIPKYDCLPMPMLDEEGAVKLLLYHAGFSDDDTFGIIDWKIIQRAINQCRFSRYGNETNHYIPLVLKVFGHELGSSSRDLWEWEGTLNELEHQSDIFNMPEDTGHHIFSVLRLAYDALAEEEKNIFLDLALCFDYGWTSQEDKWKWLRLMYERSGSDIEEFVSAIRRKGLLENVRDVTDFKIHDLYLEFARDEAQEGPFERRRFLFCESPNFPDEFLNIPPGRGWPCLKRVIIRNSEVYSLAEAEFHRCKNIEVLQIYNCLHLKDVVVRGLNSLRCLEVELSLNRLSGVETLTNLVWLRSHAKILDESSWNKGEPKESLDGISKALVRALRIQVRLMYSGNFPWIPGIAYSCLELKKRVLRELTQAPENLLENKDSGQLDSLLMQRMGQQKVFLALDDVWDDDVWDDQIAKAKKYLEAQYHDGSLVLVTSRSLDVLVERLHIPECDCLFMSRNDAFDAFKAMWRRGLFDENLGISNLDEIKLDWYAGRL